MRSSLWNLLLLASWCAGCPEKGGHCVWTNFMRHSVLKTPLEKESLIRMCQMMPVIKIPQRFFLLGKGTK